MRKPEQFTIKSIILLSQALTWTRTNAVAFVAMVLVSLICLIPLYGILFPPLPDMAEHIVVAKLLWERVSGSSHLPVEISWYAGYRLFPYLVATTFELAYTLGISFLSIPAFIAQLLIVLYAIAVVGVLYSSSGRSSWLQRLYLVCFALPTVTAMYSAAWYLGLVNYTL